MFKELLMIFELWWQVYANDTYVLTDILIRPSNPESIE